MTLAPHLKARILWGLLLGSIISQLLIVTGWSIGSLPVMVFLYLLPALTLLLHAFWTLGALRGGVLFTLGALMGWFFEVVGLKYGTFFGGDYVYGMNMISLAGVPVAVIIYWATFVYVGYAITNSFLVWTKQNKPDISRGNISFCLMLVVLDGIIVMALDLFMDPIMVHQGAWTWLQGGSYFGVPLGNFVGWFTITAIVTGIFRMWEYLKPIKHIYIERSVFLIPVISYAGGAVAFLYAAWQLEMGSFIWIGGFLMIALILINLGMYVSSSKKREVLTLAND